jgi:ribosomal protein RSM22 (predicted rRNA methylase)
MVELGTPDGFRSIRTVRTILLDCANDNETIFDVIAPCTHDGRCPMKKFQQNSRAFQKGQNGKTGRTCEAAAVFQKRKERRIAVKLQLPTMRRLQRRRLGRPIGYLHFVQTMPHGDKNEKFSYLVAKKK